MEFLKDTDLFYLALMVAVTMILGLTVYFKNRKSITSQTFLLFSATTTLWGLINYLYYHATDIGLSFILLRVVIFLAVWHSFSFFLFALVFPEEKVILPKYLKYIILPIALLTSIMNLSPLTFKDVLSASSTGQIVRVEYGPAVVIFGVLISILIFWGIILIGIKTFSKKYIKSRKEFTLLLIGIFLTLILVFTFNFIFPALLHNINFIPLGALFIFPFIACTAYAICRHHLFGIHLITMELVTFALWMTIATHIPFSRDTREVFIEANILVMTLIFCVTIIRATLYEIRQRDKFEQMTAELTKAYQYIKLLEHPINEKMFGLTEKTIDESREKVYGNKGLK